MPTTTLTLRALNRATLARQMLLAREKTTVARAVEKIAGLQAQLARPPFIGLWSRIAGFQREQLLRTLERREVVRATMMRGTLHLMSAKDYVRLRPTMQAALSRGMESILRGRAATLDVERLIVEARKHFGARPRTFAELRALLLELAPKGDSRAMGYAVRMCLPLVQVPTGAPWGFPGTADFAVADTWLGEAIEREDEPHALVLKYLAAFGPATAADVQAWSGLKGLRDVLESLRPKLRVFQDERGRELFDLAKGPRPPEEVAAPARFLPEFDSLVLAHDDRRRVVADEHRKWIYLPKNLQVLATFLVDGFVAGTWKVERATRTATLRVVPFWPLPKKAQAELAEEAAALVRFIEADAERFDVRFDKARG